MATKHYFLSFEERVDEVTKRGWPEEYAQLWWKKYYGHLTSAVYRGTSSELTFGDYLDKILEAGIKIPEQVSKYAAGYVLGRYTDEGSYTVDSCRFITQLENTHEAIKNGRWENVWKIVGDVRRGQTKETLAFLAKMAETKRGRTAETHAGIAIQADKIARDFAFQAPDGTVYRGRNLKKFCREHNLNSGNMNQLLLGRRDSVKGWKRVP
jgi:hypothetical protein